MGGESCTLALSRGSFSRTLSGACGLPVRRLPRFWEISCMLYLVYLDEFGHDSAFISRTHAKHKTSPVFGLAGIILPYHAIRNFAT